MMCDGRRLGFPVFCLLGDLCVLAALAADDQAAQKGQA
jgi:hypothetical protein